MIAPSSTIARGYLAVFAALLALTALTVGSALVDLGGVNNVVALGVAGCKAGLVAVFFMQAREASPVVKLTIFAGCVWLALLIGLTMSDFLTRDW
jgi:cytochrome c oxidase subunit 4